MPCYFISNQVILLSKYCRITNIIKFKPQTAVWNITDPCEQSRLNEIKNGGRVVWILI